jgi:HD superfamily phosphohydrolase YqeK
MGRRLLKAFAYELGKIKSPELLKITKQILLKCCDYCCDESASSTGKFHPSFSLGPGGLVKHIKAVCKNTETILRMMPQYDGEDWDIPYIAAILHDCMKYTEYKQQYTHENHPNLMAAAIRQHKTDDTELNTKLERIASNVETHMSRFNTCRHSDDIMPPPTSMENMIVAIADMISAQKYFHVEFNDSGEITNYI